MIRTFFSASLVVAVLTFAGSTSAAPDPADQGAALLVAQCRVFIRISDSEFPTATASDNLTAGYCAGYITGVNDAMAASNPTRYKSTACMPKGILSGELIRAFVKQVDAHPKLLYTDKLTGLVAAWAFAYPCSKPAG